MSSGKNPICSVWILYALWQMEPHRSTSVACPFSSNAITITAAPNQWQILAFLMNSASPSLSEIELTTLFPYEFLRPS